MYADGRVVLLNQVDANGVPIGPQNRDRLDPFVIDPVLMADNGHQPTRPATSFRSERRSSPRSACRG